MQLSASSLKKLSTGKVLVPDSEILKLPEKVLQFGTGMLLRGLPDYFIDKANKMGVFNGRVVMVKTTSSGDASVFDKQDGLFTLCVRGVEKGKILEENIINASISRVLSAHQEWTEILNCARNEHLRVIISNSTEAGIKFVNEDIRQQPPTSFPGKLLAVLLERFNLLNGREDSGFVIVPTELIPDNATKLKSIVLELAHSNRLKDDFIMWLNECNDFCNSLVDRIVTGMPDDATKKALENEWGYKDDLITFCEAYRLWAIEGDNRISSILSFSHADDGVIVEPDIRLYRELKLRVLNGTHTITSGIAFLSGIATVKHAMDDAVMKEFVNDLMYREIGTSIPSSIDPDTLIDFIEKVRDRFRNPHINHYWKNITLNYSDKLKIRCVPLLINYYKLNNSVPELFALGFAAYLIFMKPVKRNRDDFFGIVNGQYYLINDGMAETFYKMWHLPVDELVNSVLSNKTLWGEDLAALPGFQSSVTDKVNSIIKNGMRATLQRVLFLFFLSSLFLCSCQDEHVTHSPRTDPKWIESKYGDWGGPGVDVEPGAMDSMLLKDYAPASSLIAERSIIPKAKFPVVDFHTHVEAKTPEEVDEWVKTMDEVGIETSVILTEATGAEFDHLTELYLKRYPDRFVLFCGMIDSGTDKPDYPERAVAELVRCYNKGARGVGEWTDKGLGFANDSTITRDMRLHPDDPRLDPFWKKCAELKMPVNIHIADHPSAWKPLDVYQERTPDYQQFNRYGRDGSSYEELIAIRDRMLAKHPNTIFIACHLSNEGNNLEKLGKVLDAYPNLVLDISGRDYEIGRAPRAALKFFTKYASRVVFGTDMGRKKSMYQAWWKLLESEDEFMIGRMWWRYYGVGLSAPVLEKLYNGNSKSILRLEE